VLNYWESLSLVLRKIKAQDAWCMLIAIMEADCRLMTSLVQRKTRRVKLISC
jgi:hypothetical protein